MLLGIGEGVPLRIPGRGGPYRWHPVGTVWAQRNPFKSRRHRPGQASIVQARRCPGLGGASTWALPRIARYQPGHRSGGGPTGETSTRTAWRLLPGAEAGRFGVPRRSRSWSRSLTEALTSDARWAGSRPGAIASWCTISSSRRALKTIRPGSVSLAADRTASFLFALLARLCGLALGATDSSSGMT